MQNDICKFNLMKRVYNISRDENVVKARKPLDRIPQRNCGLVVSWCRFEKALEIFQRRR